MSRTVLFFSVGALALSAAAPALAQDAGPGLTLSAGVEALSPDLFEKAHIDQFVRIGFETSVVDGVGLYTDVGVATDLTKRESFAVDVGSGVIVLGGFLHAGLILGRHGMGDDEKHNDHTLLLGDVGVIAPLGGGFSLIPSVQMGASFEHGGGLASGMSLLLEKRF